MVTFAQFAQVCLIAPSTRLLASVDPLNAAMAEAEIDTPVRAAMFVAQVAHETEELQKFTEGLNYGGPALFAQWPHHFQTIEIANSYARQPQRIACRAYADRLGNGDEASGDGWRYRGRGALQMTGFAAFKACGTWLGVDLVGEPDRAAELDVAFRVGAWVWRSKGLGRLADAGNLIACTQKINGGQIGAASRAVYYSRARSAFGLVQA